MKTKFLLCFLTVSMIAVVQSAPAQQIGQPMGGVYGGGGGPVYEPGAFQPVAGDLVTGLFPGRVWVEANAAERGLGYQGSYISLGAKTRLCEDFLDGRWLGEIRANQSLNGGGFFGNMGLERVFSIDSAGADVSVGIWGDYDSDLQGNFAHAFAQFGVTAQIKTQRHDLIANGYFPQGTTGYTQGDPTGQQCFFNNSIIVQPGIDTALQGFDVVMRFRPNQLAFKNGAIELGGYGYDSDLIDFYGGARAGLSFQILHGLITTAQVNYDEVNDVTGVLGFGWIFGINARGNEYSGVGRDLEATNRNDHIVRFQQNVILAIDPDTGRPYDVWHVNNTADAGVADGTFQRPFVSLADAEAASGIGDIIFVDEGDRTARGMRNGINLKNDQLFLGDGVQHIIPIQNGLNFVLCNDTDGIRPTISGSNNGNAVNLANNNVVAGFNIDGTAGNGGMANGIFGSGFVRGQTLDSGVIRDNMISGAILDGVFLQDIQGDWQFSDNMIDNNGFDGIRIIDACDPTSILRFVRNDVSNNGRDGISIENYDAATLDFIANITNNNGRDGIRLVNFKNSSGNGLDLDFTGHVATGNNGIGINIMGGDGNLRLLNSNITGNVGGGLNIVDWTNTDPNTSTFIGTRGLGTSNFSNNQPGFGINIELNAGIQRVFINRTTLNNNGIGFLGTSSGVGTRLITRIDSTNSVNNNLADGLRIVAVDGANHNIVIGTSTTGGALRMPITGNNGAGISFFSGDNSGQVSIIEAIVANIDLTGNGAGIFSDVIDDGALQLDLSNSNIDTNGVGLSLGLDTNETQIVNTIRISNVTMLDNGTDAIQLAVGAGTFVDFSLIDSVLESTTMIDAAGDTNMLRVGGFGSGINLDVFGDDSVGNPQVDTRVRLFVQASRIDEFAFGGVDVDTFGDAHVLARIEGNDMNQNGFGIGSNGDGTGNPVLGSLFDAVSFVANDESRVDLTLTGNDITASTEAGVALFTNDMSTINTVWIGNDLSNNDQGNDPSNDPIREDNISDFNVVNAVGSNICLSMSNNFWSNGFNIVNLGAGVDYTVELDGFSNLFGPGDIGPGMFTFAPYGTVCEALISAEEAAFVANGFPPIP